jgi:hypothetical protein
MERNSLGYSAVYFTSEKALGGESRETQEYH